ncbi:PREDICTED: pentatricopeptide repeat-containing protein At3g22670, mitochondrial-like [Camelina sativa]|uniref:Pentatricopeptide repeat-containing protein At3g22670, mitochondrial-like n=1 Tax=Camelina sativa TaxID=90675 RepID=A0ABM0WB22_CAMSA|nr:PREDICTED: pentatricopeptide repeat-containing protein At3g22670, mitochondrial-like [Camelina sativa]
MLTKLRISKLVSYTIPRRIFQRRFLVTNNAFSNTEEESPVVVAAESPELPSWIKDFLSNKPSSSSTSLVSEDDEDFVIPSLANWVESQKFSSEQVSEGNVVKKKPVEDIDKVCEFLNKKDASHLDVVKELSGCNVVVTESLVLQVLRRFSNVWNQAYGFFIWANSQTGYTHSAKSYNAMVDVLGKCRSFDLMWELVDEMKKKKSDESGLVTLDTMSKVMRRLAKSGKYSEAVDAFLGMEMSYGVKTDTIAMNSLMDALVKENSHVPDLSNALMDVDEKEKIFMLSRHSEKLAMAFGLISSDKGTTIRIVKNLRVCSDCHSFAKFASKVYKREIILRDNNRFHFIHQGKCSCGDFW